MQATLPKAIPVERSLPPPSQLLSRRDYEVPTAEEQLRERVKILQYQIGQHESELKLLENQEIPVLDPNNDVDRAIIIDKLKQNVERSTTQTYSLIEKTTERIAIETAALDRFVSNSLNNHLSETPFTWRNSSK